MRLFSSTSTNTSQFRFVEINTIITKIFVFVPYFSIFDAIPRLPRPSFSHTASAAKRSALRLG